jgi:hypothetical protein
MSSLSFRRAVVALALGWILVSPLASAELGGRAPHRPSPAVTQEVQGVFGQLWEALACLWGKNGASADPFGSLGGQPVTSSSAGFCDNGMSIDPNGGCSHSAFMADAGCSGDPNGRCVSGH